MTDPIPQAMQTAERLTGWQPIETAPQDGTEILLGHFFVDEENHYCGTRWLWIASGSVADDGKFDCEFTDEYFTPEGYHKVTHWMPMPATPAIPAAAP